MTETTSNDDLMNIHRDLSDNKDKLDDNISSARDIVNSKMGWQYSIIGVDENDQELQWTFRNGETGHVYAPPSTGNYMRYEDGSLVHLFGSPFKVTWHQKSDQPGVQEARDALNEAEKQGGDLHYMNKEDLDNLVKTPDVLATSRERLSEAQSTFDDRRKEGQNLYSEPEHWDGEGYDAYARSLKVFLDHFKDISDDIKDLLQAHSPLVERIVDLAKALLQIFIDNVESTNEFLKTGISIAAGPESWSTYANLALDALADASTQHHKDLQKKLDELKESFEFKNLVELAEVKDIDNWPLPESIS